MINIEDTENKVKQVDSLLTTITNLIKKHWLILLLILVIAFGYWAWNLPEPEVIEPQPTEEYQDDTYSDDSVTEEDVIQEEDSTFVE